MITAKDLDLLFDKNSFMEIGEGRECSVITGCGTVNGRLVFAYLQDSEKMGGAFGSTAGKKISRLYRLAVKSKAPIVGLLDSAGFLIDEGAEALEAFSEVYSMASEAKKSILQIGIAGGRCLGQMRSLAYAADFFIEGEDIGKALLKARTIIEYMPPAVGMLPEQFPTGDDLNRLNEGIEKVYEDGRELLKEISDDGFFLEKEPGSTPELAAGFIRINGIMVAALASSGSGDESRMGLKALVKAERLIETADKFSLGIVFLLNTVGYSLTDDPELIAIEAQALAFRQHTASVPKILFITGKVMGGIYSLMCGKYDSCDLAFMWRGAEAGIMDAGQAAELIYGPLDVEQTEEKAAEYRRTHSSSDFLKKEGFIDKVIEPAETRKYLAGALESYANVF